MEHHALTGRPSIDKPWLKYYPAQLLDHLKVPECTLTQYLQFNAPDLSQVAMHYYGTDITWQEVFDEAERLARSLKAVGFGEGDQIPAFLRSVPEFIPLLLAAEKIGASILVRDNEIHENAEALRKSGAKTMFAHTFLPQAEMEEYVRTTGVRRFVLIDPVGLCGRDQMPHYIQKSLDVNFTQPCAQGQYVMSWCDFRALADTYDGPVEAPVDIDRPLFRCYTSGSTGPSKQVIHSAHSMIGVLVQMNFYGEAQFRPTWLLTILPPCLVAVVISMLLLPLASRKLLILDPWVDVMDLDLELMRYRPNNWPMIPMFIEMIIRSPRIPADYDMSHLMAAGAGAEAYNNTQMARAQKFLHDHNCMIPFTTGYGSSEAGSNVAFHVAPEYPQGNGNVGCPMPLTTISIFKPGTTQEVGYNVEGEICVSGPGVMLGYDDPASTARALRVHEDGKLWLHMGDIGMMNEDGVLYTRGRGTNKRFTGGFLDILPMENRLADADIDGVEDQFFVNIPDAEHEGYFEPYLYVVLRDGVTVEDVREKISDVLESFMIPAQIVQLPERPFWHFKTNRIGLTKEVLRSRACCAVN